MIELINGLFAVYLKEYPDEGSALIEAEDSDEAIGLACERDDEYGHGGPWVGERAEALTAEAMTPEAMVVRVADGEADPAGTIEGQWLANVACGQAMEIERLRAALAAAEKRAGECRAGWASAVEALWWCSGAPEFQVGGRARKGWESEVEPALMLWAERKP